ncbi:MAG: hypothetical protein DI629_07305 [Mesorhizobium amorphae]|nr:MAG: hypothetical protein DI629_07305 [Mesorhizobium amorphae]
MALFSNRQWRVTRAGLESIEGRAPYHYVIRAERMLEKTTREDGTFYDWPIQLAEKNWVNLHAFGDAFREALKHHERKLPCAFDGALVEASIARGLRERSALHGAK